MTTLQLATRDFDAFERAFGGQIAAFEAVHPDIRIERHSFTIEEHYEKFIGRKEALSGEFDLFLSVTDWLPEGVQKGLFEPLDDYLAMDPPGDWPSGWSPAMRGLPSASGRFFAVPWHDGPEVFHYRSDLFDSPRERDAFKAQHGRELCVPTTWAEFLEVARFFTRPGLWGCCVGAMPDGHNNVYDFLIHLWSRSGSLLGGDKPVFNSKQGCDALAFYSGLMHAESVAPLDCLDMNSLDSGVFYASGKAAMMWNWSGFAATAEMPGSQIAGLNRCAQIPGGTSLNIFWALTILSGSKHKDTAYKFMSHAMSPDMDKLASMSGANGVRLSTWRDTDVLARFPYYGILERVHENTRVLPPIPEYPAINESLNQAVKRVTHDRHSPESSLAIAEREVEIILSR